MPERMLLCCILEAWLLSQQVKLKARRACALPGLAASRRFYLEKPQNTSRIMLSNLSVRVSPTR